MLGNNFMQPKIDILSWDSDFFGFPIAKAIVKNELEFQEVCVQLNNYSNLQLVYLISENELKIPLNNKCKLVDEKLTFSMVFEDFKENIETGADIKSLLGKARYQKKLEELCLISGHCSRFKLDSTFP